MIFGGWLKMVEVSVGSISGTELIIGKNIALYTSSTNNGPFVLFSMVSV